jgi:hypothetical protein
MIGLFLSEAILFAVAAILGFAVGAYLYARSAAEGRRAAERDNEQLRAALTEVQVRRARGS